jgi:hypothetical protein
MENVLKVLPDKISCPDIIHKCTSNVHIFLITFKLRDTGTCFIQKIYAPSSALVSLKKIHAPSSALASFKKYIPPPLHKNDADLFFNV